MSGVASGRSFLFVPGHRPDRFAKAAASGCDAVVLDLEDAVGEDSKVAARDHVRAWLDDGNHAVVRINGAGTPWFDDDLDAVAGRALAVMVPKAESRASLDAIARRLPTGTGVIPLIETALGVAGAVEVCSADAVVRPAFGSVDLAAQLGVDHRSLEALRHARSAVVLAAAAAGCGAPIDGVTTTVDDEDVLRADLAHAVELGFTGKLCIHPRQVAAVTEAFTPSDADVAWAREVLAAVTDGSVAVHKGQMVDRPVLLRAQAILARV
ncbi:HpcH/HpaI aldolase/citrate lyase family protein [Amycolatopsis thermophila]|uniref:Citrate lyase subunit beta/citryl-CoA lyase n=1 Tax=Amycolatopsis thermophila TaxID=206084 RepID=A0ABU0F114_9PSEU|nr:CoA ester lyase [Amycolatopsis thermophila]MDQ0381039.1 citrate lyase subunit beta/citryl-CoA lyase [Amycolatopsis thermophila]